jgi:hypothetical protein
VDVTFQVGDQTLNRNLDHVSAPRDAFPILLVKLRLGTGDALGWNLFGR